MYEECTEGNSNGVFQMRSRRLYTANEKRERIWCWESC